MWKRSGGDHNSLCCMDERRGELVTMRGSDLGEMLLTLLMAGLFAYFGLQRIIGGYPLHSPRWTGVALLGAAGYLLYAAWVDRPRKAKGVVEVAIERYEELKRLDPKVAEPAMEELFANLERQLREELTPLRNAAITDPEAAVILRDKLKRQLTQSTVAINHYKRHLSDDPRLPRLLEEVEKRHTATRLELEDLETRVRRLSNKVV